MIEHFEPVLCRGIRLDGGARIRLDGGAMIQPRDGGKKAPLGGRERRDRREDALGGRLQFRGCH